MSGNPLNTAAAHVGATYNTNEDALSGSIRVSYAGLYPIIDLEARYGDRVSTCRDAVGDQRRETWKEKGLEVGLRIPLDLSRGIFAAGLELGASAGVTDISGRLFTAPARDVYDLYDMARGGRFARADWWLAWHRYRLASRRDLYPGRGQSLNCAYRHTPFGGDYGGKLFAARADLYFPGLARHHGLHAQVTFERQDPDGSNPYRYPSESPFVRGNSYVYHQELYGAAVEYALPLLYPDRSLGALAYLKRLRAAAFYDVGRGRDRGSARLYQSVGLDLTTDFNPLSLPFEFNAACAIPTGSGLGTPASTSSSSGPAFEVPAALRCALDHAPPPPIASSMAASRSASRLPTERAVIPSAKRR